MKNFADRILTEIIEKKSCVVVGLDPRPKNLPDELKDSLLKTKKVSFADMAIAYLEFNKQIIDAIAPYAPAVKPQSAFYEALGYEGIKALQATIRYAGQKGLIVIADVKRSDVPSTAAAYSNAYIGETALGTDSEPAFGADALTVNPYMGADSVKPFIDDAKKFGKGVFVLVKTSNKGSGDLQDIQTPSGKIYEITARNVAEAGNELIGEKGYSSLGAVVGATYPDEAKTLRKLMPRNIFLVPGYGAQGADAQMVKNCFNPDGFGALIVAARSIIFAYEKDADYPKKNTWQESVRNALIKMNRELL
ncbi:MAG: orotidine-5'-phosphate decarboxylase [Planctomycetes bacterium]|nr:orotidine-5'-phosphate decarboxylase [Planctomycetota bacterium]